MAKKKKKEEVAEEVETLEEDTEETTLEAEVVEEFVVQPREVTVTPMKTFTAYIANVRYDFVQNEGQKVPLDVKRVLLERNLIAK